MGQTLQHFLEIDHFSSGEIQQLLDLAIDLKQEFANGGNPPHLQGQQLAMVFQKPSLRTRISFDVGVQHLGGNALYISPNEIGLGKRESVADVARVLSRYVNGIMARVFDHQHIVELAEYASVPVINGLSDYNHPCQGLTDLLTILEHKNRLAGIRLAYIGDGNNVATSLAIGAGKMGMHFAIATPEGYALDRAVVQRASSLAEASGGSITEYRDPQKAVQDADVIYTDTWVSMGQEEEAKQRQKVFPPYQLNTALLQQAPPEAIVMHDLPAYRGYEITDEVADGPQSVIFDQAENRLHAQKAILVTLMGK